MESVFDFATQSAESPLSGDVSGDASESRSTSQKIPLTDERGNHREPDHVLENVPRKDLRCSRCCGNPASVRLRDSQCSVQAQVDDITGIKFAAGSSKTFDSSSSQPESACFQSCRCLPSVESIQDVSEPRLPACCDKKGGSSKHDILRADLDFCGCGGSKLSLDRVDVYR